MNIPGEMTAKEYQFFIKNGYLPNQIVNNQSSSHKRQNPEHDLQVWFCKELDKNNIFYLKVK